MPCVEDLSWDSPSTPFVGSAGSSKECGGRQATRTRAAGDERSGLDSVPDGPSSDAACGALHETPGHLKKRKCDVKVLDVSKYML